jgi:hypothetical protein
MPDAKTPIISVGTRIEYPQKSPPNLLLARTINSLMQLSSDVQIPDGPLAEIALLSEKPHQGVPSRNLALNQGISEANSTAAIGL